MVRRRINATHVIAYQDGGHRYLQDGVVVIEEDTILSVGTDFAGEVDETIDDPVDLARDLQAAAERMWPRMGSGDWAGRGVDELSPQSFPAYQG